MHAMSTAIVLQHVPHEGPGRIVPILRDYGIPVQIRHLYKGDEVPGDLDEVRLLIVMGGPMGVADIGQDKYPFLNDEVALIKQVIAADLPMLGICLGATSRPRGRRQGLPQRQSRRSTHARAGNWLGPGDFPIPRRH